MFDGIHDIFKHILFSHNGEQIPTQIVFDPYSDVDYTRQLQISQGAFFAAAFLVFLVVVVYVVFKYFYGCCQLPQFGYSRFQVTGTKLGLVVVAILLLASGSLMLFSSMQLRQVTASRNVQDLNAASANLTAQLPVFNGAKLNSSDTEAVITDNSADTKDIVKSVTAISLLQRSIDSLRLQRVGVLANYTQLPVDAVMGSFNRSVVNTTLAVNDQFSMGNLASHPVKFDYVESSPRSLESLGVSMGALVQSFPVQMEDQYKSMNDLLAKAYEAAASCKLPIGAEWLPHVVIACFVLVGGILVLVNVVKKRQFGTGYILMILLMALLFASGISVVPSIYYNDLCKSNLQCACSIPLQEVQSGQLVAGTPLASTVQMFTAHEAPISELSVADNANLTGIELVRGNYSLVMTSMEKFEAMLEDAQDSVGNDYAFLNELSNCTASSNQTVQAKVDICMVAKWNDNVLFFSTLTALLLFVGGVLALQLDKITEFSHLKL